MRYEDYIQNQQTRAASKWGRRGAENELFKVRLRETVRKFETVLDRPKSICCMGARDGTEVVEFKLLYPKAEVYGVDISENVSSFRSHIDVNMLMKDFNHLPDEWESKFDLVFSNSIDHAFVVEESLAEWHRVTKPNGFMLLEFSTTRPNLIEHQFKIEDIEGLFPIDNYETIEVWESPERNIFGGLFRVLK